VYSTLKIYYYYYCIILITGLQVLPTFKSQRRQFTLINRYVPCNMILTDLFSFIYLFFAILYNVENIFGPLRFHFEQVLLCVCVGVCVRACVARGWVCVRARTRA
jgi:hypothetical protein